MQLLALENFKQRSDIISLTFEKVMLTAMLDIDSRKAKVETGRHLEVVAKIQIERLSRQLDIQERILGNIQGLNIQMRSYWLG